MIAWHYSTIHKFPAICESGFLDVEKVSPESKQFTPYLWFTTRQDFEPTACKGLYNPKTEKRIPLTFAEVVDICGGAVRFGIDTERLIHWPTLRNDKSRKAIDKSAIAAGSDPNRFYVSLERMELTSFIIEFWDREKRKWTNDPICYEPVDINTVLSKRRQEMV